MFENYRIEDDLSATIKIVLHCAVRLTTSAHTPAQSYAGPGGIKMSKVGAQIINSLFAYQEMRAVL